MRTEKQCFSFVTNKWELIETFGDYDYERRQKLNNLWIALCARNTFHILSADCQECCKCEFKY